MGILTVGVVTKPFQFEGVKRMRIAETGIVDLQSSVDTLIVIPNQNLFRVANEKTTFADAFAMADQVLYSGVACITDLMVKEGLINLDFADVRAIMREMGKAMMGTGEATGEKRAILAAEAAIANPLLDEVSMKGARGLLISITGGNDLTLYEVDEAASRIRQEVDEDANIILGATFDENLDGIVRVSVVATGIDQPADAREFDAAQARIAEAANRLRAQAAARRRSFRAALCRGSCDAAPDTAARRRPSPMRRPSRRRPTARCRSAARRASCSRLRRRAITLSSRWPRQWKRSSPMRKAPSSRRLPETPKIRPQRMPQIDDLPLPAQKQIRAQRGEAPAEPVHEVKRRTLLERLAAFGIAGRTITPITIRCTTRPGSRCRRRARRQPNSIHAEYSKRSVPPARHAQQPLDPQGRMIPSPRAVEEDQLEIPAFLRRQSS